MAGNNGMYNQQFLIWQQAVAKLGNDEGQQPMFQ